MGRQAEESRSFLKKRTKKLLTVWAEPIRKGRNQGADVFWFFFEKKNSLPS
jgi:hypothetical protein